MRLLTEEAVGKEIQNLKTACLSETALYLQQNKQKLVHP